MHGAHLTLAQDHRALEPSWASADHENALFAVGGGPEALGVPATAVFLAGSGVLGAHQRTANLEAGGALVAADAFADLVQAPLLDLFREERIGDRRTGGTDDVVLARGDCLDH